MKTPAVFARTARRLMVLAIVVATPMAQAYFIRPYVSSGASFADGLAIDGATQGGVNFFTTHQSQVDLAAGTVRNYLELTGPTPGAANGQAVGIMGERLTFNNANGTTLNFSFHIDGMLDAPARDANLNSLMQLGVTAVLKVFDVSAGATYANYFSRPGALIDQVVALNYDNPTVALNELINQTLAGSVQVNTHQPLVLDVFASLGVFGSLNNNPVTVTWDFMNTGQFGVQTDPGVSYTSQSGVFLTQAVPEPQTLALWLVGLAGLAVLKRRKTIGSTPAPNSTSAS